MAREIKHVDELEEAAAEQLNEADALVREAEEHTRQVERLEQVSKEIKKGQDTLATDSLNKAEQQVERARRDTERKISELRQKKKELLDANESLLQQLRQANNERSTLRTQSATALAEAAHGSGPIKEMWQKVQRDVDGDLAELAGAETKVQEARKVIERIEL